MPDDDLVEHLGGGGGYYNLIRVHSRSQRGVIIFGNLTRYPVERLSNSLLAATPTGPDVEIDGDVWVATRPTPACSGVSGS